MLCLGPGAAAARDQARQVEALGGVAVEVPGTVAPEALERLPAFGAALWWGDAVQGRAHAVALARREGPIVPLITGRPDLAHVRHERHLCIDTTAAGGNATLLAGGTARAAELHARHRPAPLRPARSPGPARPRQGRTFTTPAPPWSI